MRRRPPRSTRTDTLFPYTTLFRSWHVIAAGRAALAAKPDARVAVLTRNLKDFNRSELRRLGLGLFDPDRFLVECLWRYPGLMTDLLACLPSEVAVAGRPAASLAAVLKRERLFRLNRVIVLENHGDPLRMERGAP